MSAACRLPAFPVILVLFFRCVGWMCRSFPFVLSCSLHICLCVGLIEWFECVCVGLGVSQFLWVLLGVYWVCWWVCRPPLLVFSLELVFPLRS